MRMAFLRDPAGIFVLIDLHEKGGGEGNKKWRKNEGGSV